MDDLANAVECVRTLRLKVKPEAYAWLNAAAIEVNFVWNWANATSMKASRPFYGPPKWLSGLDLCALSAGASAEFERIGADTVQRVCCEYAAKRRQAKRLRLRWRVSHGSRRSLGWVPFKAASLKRRGRHLRFAGKSFRVFEAGLLDGARWRQGCFTQDAVGDWWLCLPLARRVERAPAPREAVGIDLGLKATATTSDGEGLDAGRYYREIEPRIAQAQRRGHRRQAKRWHRRAARRRADALHKFSRKVVDDYQKIVIGDVSVAFLGAGRSAKAQRDAGHAMLKRMCLYKGEHAGRTVEIVDEGYTTQVCSGCGARTGPAGRTGLVVRRWVCRDCGVSHDRDVNAARNILRRAEVSASVGGNELKRSSGPPRRVKRPRAARIEPKRATA